MCQMKAVHYAARSAGPMKAKRGPVEPVEREKGLSVRTGRSPDPTTTRYKELPTHLCMSAPARTCRGGGARGEGATPKQELHQSKNTLRRVLGV